MPTKSVKKIVLATDKVVEVFRMLCVILSALFLCLMALQVFMRYSLNSPIYGIDEMVTCLMVWYCSIGTAIVFWEEAHAMIVYFLRFFPKSFQ